MEDGNINTLSPRLSSSFNTTCYTASCRQRSTLRIGNILDSDAAKLYPRHDVGRLIIFCDAQSVINHRVYFVNKNNLLKLPFLKKLNCFYFLVPRGRETALRTHLRSSADNNNSQYLAMCLLLPISVTLATCNGQQRIYGLQSRTHSKVEH